MEAGTVRCGFAVQARNEGGGRGIVSDATVPVA
jgi:hypothetical protein